MNKNGRKFDSEALQLIAEYNEKINVDKKYRERVLSAEYSSTFKLSEKEARKLKKERGIAHSAKFITDSSFIQKASHGKIGRFIKRIQIGAIRLTSLLVSLTAALFVLAISNLFFIPLFEDPLFAYILSGSLALAIMFRS